MPLRATAGDSPAPGNETAPVRPAVRRRTGAPPAPGRRATAPVCRRPRPCRQTADKLVGDGADLCDVVGHDDAGDAKRLVHRLNQPRYDAERDRVKAHERLIIDQQFRVHDDGARQRDAARHAAGEFRGHQLRCATEPDRLQFHQYQAAQQRLGQAGVFTQRERHVLKNGHVRQQRAVLKQHADAPTQAIQRRAAQLRHGLAKHVHTAPLRADRTHQQPQQRGLAGAARPQHRRNFPAPRGQIQAVEYRPSGWHGVGHVADIDERLAGFACGRRLRACRLLARRWRGRVAQAACDSMPDWYPPLRARLLSRAQRANSCWPAPRVAALPPQALNAASCSARP